MTNTEGKQHSDHEVYRRRLKIPRNGDIPQPKNKPASQNSAKNRNKAKSAIEIQEKRAKRLDDSPLRIPIKKEKHADDHKKTKHSHHAPHKSHSKNANNINKQIKQVKKKENTNKKPVTLEKPKEKLKNSISQKIKGHRRDDVEIDLASAEPKSPKVISVNKVKDWISPHVDIKRPSSSSKKALKETILNVNKEEKVKMPLTTFKRLIRRPLWQLSKGVIKSNEHWSKLMEENMIDVDKINIDALDLSLIDIDALGIENKLIKRTITWLLK